MIRMKNQILISILFVIVIPIIALAKKKTISIEQKCLNIHNCWLNESFVLTKNCVGFSAPISARAYGYVTLGMYESSVELFPSLQSLSGQLNGFSRNNWKTEGQIFNWSVVANRVDFTLLNYFYRTMPPSNSIRIQNIFDSIQKSAGKRESQFIIDASIDYANRIAQEIIEWSKSDGADDAFFNNYPSSYAPPTCPSCWTKTTPGYFNSVLPYWGGNRPFLKNSKSVLAGCNVVAFSIDTASILYQDAKNILKTAKDSDPKYELIAEYWDDSPGYSGTPSGHLFILTRSIAIHEKLSPDSTLELYVKLGVALNEAFIHCWELKYANNFLRPITYIHRYIDAQFNTFIATPSFPEFPSGHSFQSGAGTEVLKAFFTDHMPFVDSTNVNRIDINGSPRSFSSFSELGEEISISRFYGGIHFMTTLNTSLDFGQKIGNYVVNELKCRK